MKRLLVIIILQASLLCGALTALAATTCARAGMGNHSCCHHARRAAGEADAMPGMSCASDRASGAMPGAVRQLALAAAVQGCPCLNKQAPSAPVLSVSVPARVRHDARQTPTYAQALVLGDAHATLLVNARQNAPPGPPAPLFVIQRVFRL